MEIEYCLFRLGMRVLIYLAGIALYIIYIIRKRNFLIALFVKKDLFREMYKGKSDLIFFRIVNIAMFFVILMICSFMIKATMDIPFIINKNYSYLKGYTVGDSKGGANVSSERRSVFVKDMQTGKEIEIITFSDYIEDNTYVEVEYLPHTHYGAIIPNGK